MAAYNTTQDTYIFRVDVRDVLWYIVYVEVRNFGAKHVADDDEGVAGAAENTTTGGERARRPCASLHTILVFATCSS